MDATVKRSSIFRVRTSIKEEVETEENRKTWKMVPKGVPISRIFDERKKATFNQ